MLGGGLGEVNMCITTSVSTQTLHRLNSKSVWVAHVQLHTFLLCPNTADTASVSSEELVEIILHGLLRS